MRREKKLNKHIIFCEIGVVENSPQAVWLKWFISALETVMQYNSREAEVSVSKTSDGARIIMTTDKDNILCFATIDVAAEAKMIALDNPYARIIVFTGGSVPPRDPTDPDNFEIMYKPDVNSADIDKLFFG